MTDYYSTGGAYVILDPEQWPPSISVTRQATVGSWATICHLQNVEGSHVCDTRERGANSGRWGAWRWYLSLTCAECRGISEQLFTTGNRFDNRIDAVSYTHLTLPTIYSV